MNPSLKYLLLGTVLFLQASRASSQMNIDSLQNALAKEKEDSLTIATYLESMTKLKSTEVEAKTIMAKWALQKAEKLKSPYLVTLANLRLGAIYFRITVDLPLAFKYLTEAESIANKHQFWDLESRALNFLSNIYSANKQYQKHEEMTLKCIEICKKANIVDGLAAAYANLSSVYAVRSVDTPKYLPLAIQYRWQSIKTGEEIKDTVNLINNYMLISSLYLDRKKDFDSARMMLVNAEKYIRASNKGNFFSKYYYYKGNLLQKRSAIIKQGSTHPGNINISPMR
jgi:hypothetical protein